MLSASGIVHSPTVLRRWLADDPVRVAVATSLVLHAVLFMAATTWRPLPVPLPERVVSIEMPSPAVFDALLRPGTAPATAPSPPAVERTPGDGMVRPTRMLSAAALAEPRSRQAREMLPRLDVTERDVQLCNVEAMEQVRAWDPTIQPERIVAYATHDLVIAGDRVLGNGAAFLAGNAWHALRFDCGLSADHKRVTSFAFAVGNTIPRGQWGTLNLPEPKAGGDED